MEQKHVILIVDDDPAILELFENLIETIFVMDQHRVELISNAENALAFVAHTKPQLIILDYMLPRMNGEEMIDELDRQGYSDIPIIMISAINNLPAKVKTRVNTFIAKPFSIVELMNAFAKWHILEEQQL